MNILPIAAAAGIFFLFAQSKKSTSSKSTKKPPVDNPPSEETPSDVEEYEDFPNEVDKLQNSKNIEPYFMINEYYVTEVPTIYNDMAPLLRKTYDPVQTPAYSQAFLYIDKEFAEQVWDLATHLALKGIIKDGILIKPNTKANANIFAKEILQTLVITTDKGPAKVYWGDGLAPYAYGSQFYYVWMSVRFLAQLAWANILAKKGDQVGLILPKSIEE